MKNYLFPWKDDIYLIHVQFDMENEIREENKNIIITRHFEGNLKKKETRYITNNSFRFIISRSCPEEEKINISYDDSIIMKVYLIDDRAYYPTEVYYKG